MKQQNDRKTEYPDSRFDGVYRTGNTTPPKNGSPLVCILLMALIFTGGICSAMGIVNLHLLAALQQQPPQETVPILLQPNSGITAVEAAPQESEPVVPDAPFTLELSDAPETLPDTDVQTLAEASRVTVQLGDTLTCTGLVLTENGYILTSAHGVEDAQQIIVTLPGGEKHRAAVVGCDALSDLAVLYVRASSLTPATFGTLRFVDPGSKVTAVSSAGCTGGAIFRSDRSLQIGGQELPLLKTSAADAMATGSLWSANGTVLGVVSSRIGQFFDREEDDTAYVIPSATIKVVVDQLLSSGFVAGRPALGAQVEQLTDIHRNYWQLPCGLRITESSDDALQAGDILTCLNGQAVSDRETLYEILFSCRVGQTVQAEVYRGGQTVTVSVSLKEAGA